ncbi:MAG: NUDIX hydrolase, partial [Candidatus Paceibacteria bacterium]
LPNGKRRDYYIKNEGNPVTVLALTPEQNVLLVKQFRPGPKVVLHELPGGGIDGEETPEEAIQRELQEETGYHGNIERIGFTYECGYAYKWRYVFVATECVQVSEQSFDEHEFIEREEVSLTEFRDLLRKGQLTDVDVAYLGLDYLNLL